MKPNRKNFLMLAEIFAVPVLTAILGTALLLLAYSLPTGRIHKNVRRSLPMLTQETDYFSVTPTFPASQVDNFTEALYLNHALVGKKDVGLWHGALGGYCYWVDVKKSPVENLSRTSATPRKAFLGKSVRRFFNGYEVVLKPLLLCCGYSSIRQLNLTVCFALLVLLCFMMYRKGLGSYILPVLVSIWSINPVTVGLCMSFVGFYYCMIVPCIVLLTINEKLKSRIRLMLFFDLIGACTFYFNMNYFQLVTFAVPLAFHFMLNGIPESTRQMLRTTLILFISWFVGYAGTMVGKWLIYAVVIDPDIFREIVEKILLHSSDTGSQGAAISRIYAVVINFGVALQNYWWSCLEAAFVLGIAASYLKKRIRLELSRSEVLLFILMLLFVIGRFVIFANHVYIHAWTTYRILLIPILYFNILIVRAGKNHGSK